MITPFAVVFIIVMFCLFIYVCVLVVLGEEIAADQVERDRIARKVEAQQRVDGAILHLRRGSRIP